MGIYCGEESLKTAYIVYVSVWFMPAAVLPYGQMEMEK